MIDFSFQAVVNQWRLIIAYKLLKRSILFISFVNLFLFYFLSGISWLTQIIACILRCHGTHEWKGWAWPCRCKVKIIKLFFFLVLVLTILINKGFILHEIIITVILINHRDHNWLLCGLDKIVNKDIGIPHEKTIHFADEFEIHINCCSLVAYLFKCLHRLFNNF